MEFLPADDERTRSTIAAVEDRLSDDGGLVFRYRHDDDLPGDEGTFLLRTFWLAHAHAHAHALAGNVKRARDVFETAVSVRNDVDLLAEEFGDGQLLGNFPQAFGHVGLIDAAWVIAETERTGPTCERPAGRRRAAGDVPD